MKTPEQLQAEAMDGIEKAVALVTLLRDDRQSEATALLMEMDETLLACALAAAARMVAVLVEEEDFQKGVLAMRLEWERGRPS